MTVIETSRGNQGAQVHTRYNDAPRRSDASYPSDQALILLMQEHGTYGGVAAAVGVARESLRDFLKVRPTLKATMDVYSVRHRTEQDRQQARTRKLEGNRQRMRRLRREDPEGMRAQRREEMRRLPAETRRRWNQYNKANRAQVAKPTDETWAYLELIVNDPCVYCGAPSEENDHIEPVTLGGGWEWDNFARACERCNRSKKAKRLLHFLAWRTAA